MSYTASPQRYGNMPYRYCGKNGLQLPAISLGLWQNFGDSDVYDTYKSIILSAFDHGITHFDLANNYGPPPGSAETNFGRIFEENLKNHRDELIISTKAGYIMWDGPYGRGGSRKYLLSSLDQSLKRMRLDYVDIFYHHCPDYNTPLEESLGALDTAVRQGKALYAAVSNYPPDLAKKAFEILQRLGTPCLIHQPKYSMLVREPEKGLLDVLGDNGVGCIPFSPLAQGLLTNKYLIEIPNGSRATKNTFLRPEQITQELLEKVKNLNELANERGQSLAQMAIAWLLKDKRVTSVLIGARTNEQIYDSLNSLRNLDFSEEELIKIDTILSNNQ